MWEKFKNSKLATKMKDAKSSRVVYVTTVTLLLAVAVLITATAIANRVKKQNGQNELPPAGEQQGNTPEDEGSSGDGNNGADGGVKTGLTLGGGFLLLNGALFFRDGGIGQTGLLFSGCAHVSFIPLVFGEIALLYQGYRSIIKESAPLCK